MKNIISALVSAIIGTFYILMAWSMIAPIAKIVFSAGGVVLFICTALFAKEWWKLKYGRKRETRENP